MPNVCIWVRWCDDVRQAKSYSSTMPSMYKVANGAHPSYHTCRSALAAIIPHLHHSTPAIIPHLPSFDTCHHITPAAQSWQRKAVHVEVEKWVHARVCLCVRECVYEWVCVLSVRGCTCMCT